MVHRMQVFKIRKFCKDGKAKTLKSIVSRSEQLTKKTENESKTRSFEGQFTKEKGREGEPAGETIHLLFNPSKDRFTAQFFPCIDVFLIFIQNQTCIAIFRFAKYLVRDHTCLFGS